ncbi:hypothetical protein MED01_002314 [Micromonospora sp. MED01]|uniref:hypothetical protein n=1 Tax=Micromonospora alfalfae TaxID=2911212 RepID=UPI001EE93D11|nr:hypothetical protein [Micromonospora alfalfae]MCG5464149.1 hypothetical protein [Micromonospora alfalfae]
MTAGLLRLVPTDGRPPTVLPFKAEDVPAALRLLGRYAAAQSVRSGRRRVEFVVGGGDAA